MSKGDIIHRINDDFEDRNAPFDKDDMFPEERLIAETDPMNQHMEANIVTAFCTLDINRDAMRLKDNLVELYERDPAWFAPRTVSSDRTDYSEETLAEVMGEIGFRYHKNRDPKAIITNWSIIAEKYGTVRGLINSVDHNAPSLVERLNDDGFYNLKGKKLAPFYARCISGVEEHELRNLHMLDIPVDTHIRRLTEEIFQQDLTDGNIRHIWKTVQRHEDVDPHMVDGALWLIGRNWSDWGEDYFAEVTGFDEFKWMG